MARVMGMGPDGVRMVGWWEGSLDLEQWHSEDVAWELVGVL
jgi:hypothetical protein